MQRRNRQRPDWSPLTDPALEYLQMPHLCAQWDSVRRVSQCGWAQKGALVTQATAINQPLLTLAGNAGNLCLYSVDLTQAIWTTANGGTKDSAVLFTFGGINSTLLQQISTVAGITYRLEFKVRRIGAAGNTALRFYHNNSATGNGSALTINDVLTTYSVDVLGRTGNGLVDFGIRDENAAGHGQIEITEISVRQTTWENTYVPTTDHRLYPSLGNGREALQFDGTDDFERNPTPLARIGVGQPFTIAAVFRPVAAAIQSLLSNTIGATNRMHLIWSTNKVVGGVYDGVNIDASSSVLSLNSLVLAVLSYNGTTPTLRVNRVAQSGTDTATPSSSAGLAVGSNAPGNSGFFNGTIGPIMALSRVAPELPYQIERWYQSQGYAI